MFETTLTEDNTTYASREEQVITTSSIITGETYRIDYEAFPTTNTNTALGEQQSLSMTRDVVNFKLSFMSSTTATLRYGISVVELTNTINDLPTIYPNKVSVNEVFDISGIFKFFFKAIINFRF